MHKSCGTIYIYTKLNDIFVYTHTHTQFNIDKTNTTIQP